jgi:hypothetical protein
MRCLTIVAFCFFSTFSFSQSKKSSYILGDEIKMSKNYESYLFIGNEKDGVANLFLDDDKINISKYDYKTLNKREEEYIEVNNFSGDLFTRRGTYPFGENLYRFYSDMDKPSSTEYLYCDKLDIKNAKTIKTQIKLLEVTSKLSDKFYRNSSEFRTASNNKFKFVLDVSKTRLLIIYKLEPEERKNKANHDRFGFTVFDHNMNKLWGNEFTMPFTEVIMANYDFSLDSKGNVYLVSKVFSSEKRKEKNKETDKPDYQLEIFKFVRDNKEVMHSMVDIGDSFIQEVKMQENGLNEMLIACTYSKKSDGGSVDGILIARMDKEFKITNLKSKQYKFPIEELVKYEKEKIKKKRLKKSDYEYPNLVFNNILFEADGSLYVDFEETTVYTTTSSTKTIGINWEYTYYYDNIIAAKINADGKLAWVRKIPKKQMSRTQGNDMGYRIMHNTNGYYYLFLDHHKNSELDEDEEPNYLIQGYGANLVVCKIDTDGVLTKEVILNSVKEDLYINPKSFDIIENNKFIGLSGIFGTKKKYKPLLITVN